MVIGHGLAEGFLTTDQVRDIATRGLSQLNVNRGRVLVLIPDSTRTMPMPLMFDILDRELGPRVAALDFLVALGTHTPMSDSQLSMHVGREVNNGRVGAHHIFNHAWDNPESFATIGTIAAEEIEQITGGMLKQDVAVSLNRLILDYDHLLICGPVFPHEVAGFSGGAKYFFPGIAGPEIIHFTHWLGALLTSYDIIGTADTLVRRVIHRAVEMMDRPHSLLAPVLMKEASGVEVAGIFCGPTIETWSVAAELSSRRHVVYLDKPVKRVLSILPQMYDDLWTGAKGMYKVEPVIADGGEVVIYAPHIAEVSYVHGKLIDEIGYHCRDYFLAQWEKFGSYPRGILAHSTHLRGKGTYDISTGVESPRIQVTLATGIPEERCWKINLGYLDPAWIDVDAWKTEGDTLVVPHAGEMLYRLT